MEKEINLQIENDSNTNYCKECLNNYEFGENQSLNLPNIATDAIVIKKNKEKKEKLIEREQYYIDTLKPEYNILLLANSSLGYKHSEQVIAKMKEIGKTQPVSDKTIKAMSDAVRGKSKSYEHKLKISLTKTGIPCSNERKENIRKAYHDRIAKQILTNISNPMRIQNGN
mgnify:CR=1 FL=1